MTVDIDKMADRVAEKALDEFTYKDKTLREWVEIIVAQDLLAITELEKIKAEIEEKEFKLNCATMSGVALKTAYIEVAKLLDNHISELKGEGNE